MPRGKQHPPEVKEQALALAAGGSGSAAARQIGASPSTVNKWVREAEPATIARYAQQKAELGAKIGADHIEAVTRRLWEGLETIPVETAKDLQALAVAYGISVEKMRLNAGLQGGPGGTRFGNGSPELAGWSEADRVVLERIERVTVTPADPAPQVPAEQVIDLPPPGVGKAEVDERKKAQRGSDTPTTKRVRRKKAAE